MTSTNTSSVTPDPDLPSKEAVSVPVDLPPASDMPGAGAKSKGTPFPPDLNTLVAKSDEFIERLAKLIKTTAGLGSLLSTISYSLYIVAYLDANSPTRAQIVAAISKLIGRTPQTIAPIAVKPAAAGAAPVSKFAPYIALLNDTRFALRLTGLIPLYMLLKSILKQPPQDHVLRLIAQVQVSCYLAFTALENLWFLSSKNLLPPTVVNRLGGPLKLLTLSCRPWLVAIMCDYARLIREAQLTKLRKKKLSAKEQEAAEKKWYGDLFVATSYLPMAIHYSLPGGIGLNTGMVGMSGFFGGGAGLAKQWAATKE